MAIDKNINTLEQGKFLETPQGDVAVRVALSGGLAPEVFDTVTVTYPTATTEVYAFTLNASPVGTVTVTYTDSTKEALASAVRT